MPILALKWITFNRFTLLLERLVNCEFSFCYNNDNSNFYILCSNFCYNNNYCDADINNIFVKNGRDWFKDNHFVNSVFCISINLDLHATTGVYHKNSND